MFFPLLWGAKYSEEKKCPSCGRNRVWGARLCFWTNNKRKNKNKRKNNDNKNKKRVSFFIRSSTFFIRSSNFQCTYLHFSITYTLISFSITYLFPLTLFPITPQVHAFAYPFPYSDFTLLVAQGGGVSFVFL